jgi:hypothetical protein
MKLALIRGETIGPLECPLMRRWGIQTPWGELLLHHFLRPDPDAPHDHPWSFLTFVFRGYYWDVRPDGREYVRAPAIRLRAATHRHTVETTGAWSLVLAGPHVRRWWMYVDGARVSIKDYLEQYGPVSCIAARRVTPGDAMAEGPKPEEVWPGCEVCGTTCPPSDDGLCARCWREREEDRA